MKYYDYDLLPFKIHVIQTNRFKTVSVQVNFYRTIHKEEITKRNILCSLLASTTKAYPKERFMSMKRQELYAAGFRCISMKNINEAILRFQTDFLNEKYTEPGMLKETLDFFISMIMEPNVTDGKFDEEQFHLVKKRVKKRILQAQENNRYVAERRISEIMCPDTPLAYSSLGDLEDLEHITNEEIYQYYLEVLQKDTIDIYVCGDVDPDYIKDYFMQMIYLDSSRLKAVYNYQNWDYSKEFAFTSVIPFKTGEWWDSQLMICLSSLHQQASNYYDAPFDRRIWNIAGNWSNTFTLSKRPNIKMEISATGTSKSIQGSYTIAPAAFIHTAIRYTFAGDKAMIQIKGNDLFNGSNHLTTKVRNGNQYLDMYLNNYMRNVTVSFSYKFGGFKKKEVKDVDLSRFKH